ncbi:MAG: Rpn family recombination-promoting nuclease/putative transposase, partial [Lachnospiraceae bacterium]|nr:Rpn family recombination-promoting nuclease/putative transposase [Lachnospiraceae bacterium]
MKQEQDILTPAKEKAKRGIKPFSELCMMDNYLFSVATMDLETCKSIIEIALHIRIKEIRFKEGEKVLPGPPGKRGVRLDFVAIDGEGRLFDVEMQAHNRGNLQKRTRFYKAKRDSPLLNQGEIGFEKLPRTYIIFICDFDLFGQGRYRYTFRNHCEEDLNLVLQDEVCTVFLNTQGTNPEEVEPELVEFMKFVRDNAGESANEYTDERIRRMYDKVKHLRRVARMEEDYMESEWWLEEEREIAREEGREEGRQEGREEGRQEGREEGRQEGRHERRREGRQEGRR